MPPVKFDEAIAFYKQKLPLPTEVWDQVINESQDWAFTLAGVEKASVLQSVFDLILKVVEGRSDTLTTYEDFAKNFNQAMVAGGYGEQQPWRTKLVFKQNIKTAYNAGRYRTQTTPEAIKRRPYLQYIHGHPIVPRPHHKALDKMVFRADDPILNYIYPNNGFGCFLAGTKIATPDGWQNIESLKQGDLIINGDGDVEPISDYHFRRYTGRIIGIEVEGVDKLFATENHRILTMRGWIRAGELVSSDKIVKLAKFVTPRNPSINDYVLNIDNSSILSTDNRVSSPRQGESALIHNLNAETKRRNKNINPSPNFALDWDVVLMNTPQALPLKKINYSLFTKRWLMRKTWISNPRTQAVLQSFFSNFRNKKRTIGFELFSSSSTSFVNLFGLAKARMNIVQSLLEFMECFPGLLFAGRIINPLQSYSLASAPFFDFITFKQSDHTAKVNLPSASNFLVTQLFDDIKLVESIFQTAPFNGFDFSFDQQKASFFQGKNLDIKFFTEINKSNWRYIPFLAQNPLANHFFDVPKPQGFVDGAPLNSFNSLDDFVDGIGHNKFVANKITSLTSLQVDCPVYNLTVNSSHSYNTPVGIVHNCHCQMYSLSDRDMIREGLDLAAPITERINIRDRLTGKTQSVPAIAVPKSEFNGNYPPGAIIDGEMVLAPIAEPGFNYAPGKSQPEQREEILQGAIARLSPRLQKLINDAQQQ